jgi:hypothetical protein
MEALEAPISGRERKWADQVQKLLKRLGAIYKVEIGGGSSIQALCLSYRSIASPRNEVAEP